MFDNYARIIEFIPYQSNQMDITRIFKNRSPKSAEMKILISQHVPELWDQNKMKTLGVYFVYAECEEDILDAIQMLQPFVSGVQQLNKTIE
jgi:RNA recognition motif-containing protein